MRFAGIQEKNIDSFLQEVEGFNTIIGGKSLVSSGFSTINSFEPDYDYVEMIEKWDAQYPEFIGYNCRISTYDLMKDFISVKNPDTKDSQWLVFDANAIENNPKKLFSPQEYEDFKTLFASIPAEDTTDIQVHLKKVQAEWKRRGIAFNQDHKASIISVFFHDFEDYLFIGHMGVLLPTPEGKLLFLEKLSFHAPYQAIKFNNRVELNDYLMGKYDISWNQPTAKPFIMENDELLEGYRPNQKESTNH